MTRQLTRLQAVQLGLAVLLGAALATWALLKIEDRHTLGGDTFVVESGFADIAGVEVGTRVRLQGIDAGEVVAVIPPQEPGADVQLRMRLAGKLRHLVTADARVQIGSDSLFSGRVVRILPGKLQAGLIRDGGSLTSAPAVELSETIAQSAARFSALLTEVDNTLQDVRRGQGTLGMLLKDSSLYTELTTTLAEVKATFNDVRLGKGVAGAISHDLGQSTAKLNEVLTKIDIAIGDIDKGEGTLGKLVKNNDAYTEAIQSLQDLRRMVASVKQNSDAIKSLPVVRSYVVDAHKELVRPDCQRFCKWYSENELFEPGRAVLTAEGRKRLEEGAVWLNGHKEVGSEVLVASFAQRGMDADVAQTLTQKQSEVVSEYLKSSHQVQRTGWWFWSTRTVRAVGVGTNPPAIPGSEKLPPARIELLVFVPGS